MTDAKVSKRPWKVFQSGDNIGIVDANGAWVSSIDIQFWESSKRVEELEHIAHCVNLHDELVEALESVLALVKGEYGYTETKADELLARAKDGAK